MMKELFDAHRNGVDLEGEICGELFMALGWDGYNGGLAVKHYLEARGKGSSIEEAMKGAKNKYSCRPGYLERFTALIGQVSVQPSMRNSLPPPVHQLED